MVFTWIQAATPTCSIREKLTLRRCDDWPNNAQPEWLGWARSLRKHMSPSRDRFVFRRQDFFQCPVNWHVQPYFIAVIFKQGIRPEKVEYYCVVGIGWKLLNNPTYLDIILTSKCSKMKATFQNRGSEPNCYIHLHWVGNGLSKCCSGSTTPQLFNYHSHQSWIASGAKFGTQRRVGLKWIFQWWTRTGKSAFFL